MPAQHYSVLHVDDDRSMTEFVRSVLAKRSIECTSLNDPQQALDVIREHNIRVVILDIDMPELNGIELLQKIKQYDGGINVIMLTGIVTQGTVIRSLRRGALACLFKPLSDPQELVNMVELAFSNIDRWWNSLRQLVALRRDVSTPMSDHEISELVASGEGSV
jgi:DNA-binding NtrC family response regulator